MCNQFTNLKKLANILFFAIGFVSSKMDTTKSDIAKSEVLKCRGVKMNIVCQCRGSLEASKLLEMSTAGKYKKLLFLKLQGIEGCGTA